MPSASFSAAGRSGSTSTASLAKTSGMEAGLVVKRWTRYGKDRLYVKTGTGEKVGFIDLLTGQFTVERPDQTVAFHEAVSAHQGAQANPGVTRGVPVTTFSIGGARNSGLLAMCVLAVADPGPWAAMTAFQVALANAARAKDDTLQAR